MTRRDSLVATGIESRLNLLGAADLLCFAAHCASQLVREMVDSAAYRSHDALQSYEIGPIADLTRFCRRVEDGDSSALAAPIAALKSRALHDANAFYHEMLRVARDEYPGSPHDFDAWYDSHHDRGYELSIVADCLAAVADAAIAFTKNHHAAVLQSALETVGRAVDAHVTPWWTNPRVEEYIDHIRLKLDLLCAASSHEHGGEVRPVLGLLITDLASSNEVVEVAASFLRLINERVRPEDLLRLTPREFECLVGELWKRFGYQVELTKRTRDGGRDIIAIRREEIGLRVLIECKRFDLSNKVGVDLVRTLYGVKTDECASKAVLATTSTFSSEAMRFCERHYWELEPCDHEDVITWIRRATLIPRAR